MKTIIATPFEFLFDQLRDLYSMEVQLFESMPHLVSLCTNVELRSLLVSHTHLNGNQIVEIAAIFERQGESSGGDKCMAMTGLIEEGTARLESAPSPHTRDLMLVTLCRRIGRFEMAAYEITTLLSGRLGLMREPLVLSELLANEKDMASELMELEPDLFKRASSIVPGSSPKRRQRFSQTSC